MIRPSSFVSMDGHLLLRAGGDNMTSTKKDPVLVVLQLTGGKDYLHTVIPYTDPLYYDNRPVVGIPQEQALRLDEEVGFHPNMAPLRGLYEQGNVAIIHGVGYPNSPRSHFRSMDIWHTCEPDKLGTEGWLGLATRDIDPKKENVVTTVSFGPSLFRAVAAGEGRRTGGGNLGCVGIFY